jgi:hypothetical protein
MPTSCSHLLTLDTLLLDNKRSSYEIQDWVHPRVELDSLWKSEVAFPYQDSNPRTSWP